MSQLGRRGSTWGRQSGGSATSLQSRASSLNGLGARLTLTEQIADQSSDLVGGERLFHESVWDVFNELSRSGSDGPAAHEHQALNLLGKRTGKGGVNIHSVGARHH